MTLPPFLTLTLLALAPALAGESPALGQVTMAQLTIHQRIIIRIPRVASAPPKPEREQRWVEKRGPTCVAMTEIAGADVPTAKQVDLVKTDGSRIRAKLDEACPSLDFYSGFYLRQTPDGMVCAARDSFRSRSGGACQISEFKGLRKRHWLDNLPLIRKR